MKSILFTFLILSFNSFIFAQGGWNIGYLKVENINKNDIGKTFRIDFKSDKIKEKDPFIRSYFSTKDSNFLLIDNNKIKFIEERKINVDSGYYDNQFLICKSCKAPLKILDMILLEIKIEKLVFLADFELDIDNKANTIKFKKEIEVSKNELDGLIFLNSKF
ncbi:hypothetical protein ACLB9Y_17775 [Chryseobacterium scophthalmum]|uniref:hypothetical protein n=1 Tax=Chryseobacterium scophthalmum TaxID=59733 RepID=UPI00398A7065